MLLQAVVFEIKADFGDFTMVIGEKWLQFRIFHNETPERLDSIEWHFYSSNNKISRIFYISNCKKVANFCSWNCKKVAIFYSWNCKNSHGGYG